MHGWALSWLEVAPVAIAAVLVFRHVRDMRRAADETAAAAETARAPEGRSSRD